MASSDHNIQPAGRSGGAGGSPQGYGQATYQGTITGMRIENGVQTLDIQSSQGRIRLQADGDFHLGDHIRLSLAPGGPVTVEKTATPPVSGDWEGVDYMLPPDLSALNDVRGFEEELAGWVSGRNPGSAKAPAGQPPGGGLAAAAGGETDALLRLPLPELLKRVLVRDGGRDMLSQAVGGLEPGAFSYLLAGLEEAKSEPGMASLLELVKNMRAEAGNASGARRAPSADAQGMGGKAGALLMGGNAFATQALGAGVQPADQEWQAEAGKGAAPWFGRVADRQEVGASFSPPGRMGSWTPPKEAPLYKYLIDLGGGTADAPRTMTAYSAQERAPGEFVDFELEKGPRLQARFLDAAQTLPPSARTAFASAPPELRPALQVAAHYLRDFRNEPYFPQLTKDFAEVLAQSGRLEDDPAAQAEAAVSAAPQQQPKAQGLPAAQMPNQKDLDGLLRLFLAFPRDEAEPARQAKVWGDAVRNPQALLDLLKSLRPEGETSLLRAATPLHLVDPRTGEALPPAGPPGPRPAASEDQVTSLLRKLLPEAFRSEDVSQAARDAALGAAKTPDGKEAARFLLQAFSGAVPREQDMREGQPNPFYFYQNQEWRNLQVTWKKDPDSQGRAKAGAKPPVSVRVETQARHMGKVDVKVSLDDKGNARLDFRNQFHDMREALGQAIPELERSLDFLDFHVQSWTYEILKDDSPAAPGWTRPAGLDGSNLDLFG